MSASKPNLTIRCWQSLSPEAKRSSEIRRELTAIYDAWHAILPDSTFVRLDLALLLDFCVPNFERRSREDRQAFVFETPIVKLINREKERRHAAHDMRGIRRAFRDWGAKQDLVFALDLEQFLHHSEKRGTRLRRMSSSSPNAPKQSPIAGKKEKSDKYAFWYPDRNKIIHLSVIKGYSLEKHCEAMDAAKIETLKTWQDAGCPKCYVEANQPGKLRRAWRRRIQREMYRHQEHCGCKKPARMKAQRRRGSLTKPA